MSIENSLLQRIETRIVLPEWAERVVSPAYDVLRPLERDRLMDQDPYVFLHVTSSKSDETEVAKTNANFEALKRLYEVGAYSAKAVPSL